MKPGERLTTAGDLTRKERLGNALVRRLRSDPRVQAAYLDVAAIGDLVMDGWTDDDVLAAQRGRISWLVRNELGLPWPWLAVLLHGDAMAWLMAGLIKHETGTDEPLHAEIVAPDVPDLPRGRAPKADDYLARDVDWYYRARVQSPPEAIKALARAYARDTGRHTDARSVVQNAIQRIDRLLGTLDTDPA